MIRCRIGMPRCGICGRIMTPDALTLGWRMCWEFFCPMIIMDKNAESPPENEEKKEDYFFFMDQIFRKMRQSR